MRRPLYPDDPLFSDEQIEFRNTVRRFAGSELAAGYLERAKGSQFPWKEYRRLGELGILGLPLPPQYGGQGVEDFVAMGLAIEELAYADFNIAAPPIAAWLAGRVIKNHGESAMLERWLPAIAAGEVVVCLALTEPGSGSDVAALQTCATRRGRRYVLSGEKTSVTYCETAQAALIFATTDPSCGASGISCFLVPMDAPGISTSRFRDSGFRPLGRGIIRLDGVSVPAEHRIGPEGAGFMMIMRGFDFTRPLLGLMEIGSAEACLDLTVDYVQHRQAFGAPVSKFQGVSFPLAEHATYLDAARSQCYRALLLQNAGRLEPALSAMCKWWASEVAFRAIHDMIVLHGHVAYSEEYPLEQRLRDAMALEIGDGTSQIMKLIIAKQMFATH